MALVERVAALEEEVAGLRAVVDGGEVQTREAIVVAVGLLASYAARSGALDLDRLIEFLVEQDDPHPAPDDRTGLLVHGIRLVLAFHRDLERGGGEPLPPIEDILGTVGMQEILRRSEAIVDFERASLPGGGRRSTTDGSGH